MKTKSPLPDASSQDRWRTGDAAKEGSGQRMFLEQQWFQGDKAALGVGFQRVLSLFRSEGQHGRSFSRAFCLGLVQNEDRG